MYLFFNIVVFANMYNYSIFFMQTEDDHVALVSSSDVELGMMSKNKLPPEWYVI